MLKSGGDFENISRRNCPAVNNFILMINQRAVIGDKIETVAEVAEISQQIIILAAAGNNKNNPACKQFFGQGQKIGGQLFPVIEQGAVHVDGNHFDCFIFHFGFLFRFNLSSFSAKAK